MDNKLKTQHSNTTLGGKAVRGDVQNKIPVKSLLDIIFGREGSILSKQESYREAEWESSL